MPGSKYRLRCLGSSLLLVFLCALSFGQERPEGGFAEEIDVIEVLLDVLVTDKKGQVIVGLGRDDFEVLEDGEPVPITGLIFYSSRQLLGLREPLEQGGLTVDEVAEDRYFILFFQQQRRAAADVPGLMGRQLEAARETHRWIAEDLQASDRVAVTVFETRLELIQDFTNNVEELQKAVTAASQGQGDKQNWPSRQSGTEVSFSLAAHLPRGKALGKATPDAYRALQVLARAAGAIRGRKNLLFFGRGIGEVGRSGLWEPDPRFWDDTVEALNDNNIAVYPLDLMPQGSRHTLEHSLQAIASETGGTYHRLFTSFATPLQKISDENGGYYLLSYESRRPVGESGFQKVKVSTRNPQLQLRARRGYLFGSETQGAEPKTSK